MPKLMILIVLTETNLPKKNLLPNWKTLQWEIESLKHFAQSSPLGVDLLKDAMPVTLDRPNFEPSRMIVGHQIVLYIRYNCAKITPL